MNVENAPPSKLWKATRKLVFRDDDGAKFIVRPESGNAPDPNIWWVEFRKPLDYGSFYYAGESLDCVYMAARNCKPVQDEDPFSYVLVGDAEPSV